MVRGVVKNGIIQPLTPLPPNWRDGQAVSIESTEPTESAAEIERWISEMRDPASGASREDSETALAAINEHRSEQREIMRKRMGLRG